MADLILSRLRRTLQSWFTAGIGFEGAEQGSQPTQPSSGYRQIYAKSDGWYDQDDAGVETLLGSGEGVLSEAPAINDGRLTLVSSSQIKWDGYRVSLWDPSVGRDVECIPSSTPVLNYNDNELYYDEALAAGYAYDVYLEFASATSAALKAVRWADTPSTTRNVTPALWHGRYRYDNTTDTGKKRLWVGTVYLDTGPVFKDARETRFIWNKYNQTFLSIGLDNPYSSNATDNPASTSWEGWASSDTTWKTQFVVGQATLVSALARAGLQSTNQNGVQIGIGLDSNSVNSARSVGNSYVVSDIYLTHIGACQFGESIVPGYHYMLPLQARVGASSDRTVVFYATTLATSAKTANFDGWIMG